MALYKQQDFISQYSGGWRVHDHSGLVSGKVHSLLVFIFYVHVYVQICGSMPIKARRGFQHSGTGATGSCESPVWVLRTELGPCGRATSELKC